MKRPLFSVVTATYNRANLLSRAFESLMNQTLRDFEWVVIDDGSTDSTQCLVEEFKSKAFFNIKYIKTDNQGKANALNASLSCCEGVLYLVLDSDDWCDSDALEVFWKEYEEIDKAGYNKNEYFSLSCLKRYQDGRVVGGDYSSINKYGCTYVDRLNKNIKGDKWECLVFDKVRGCRYPVAPGEKYMAPSYVWNLFAGKGFKTVFINRALSCIEYQEDGISNNNIKHRLSSLESTIVYNKEFFELAKASYLVRGRFFSNYVRFSFHARRLPFVSFLYFPFYVVGLGLFLKDVR